VFYYGGPSGCIGWNTSVLDFCDSINLKFILVTK
jgi:hypothetical protein